MGDEMKIARCKGATERDIFWGNDEATHNLAIQCRDQMEKETGKPYHIVTWKANEGVTEPVDPFFDVGPYVDCKEGAVADDYLSDNKPRAQECAEALSRVTKTKYEVVVTHRLLFRDIYTVKRSK